MAIDSTKPDNFAHLFQRLHKKGVATTDITQIAALISQFDDSSQSLVEYHHWAEDILTLLSAVTAISKASTLDHFGEILLTYCMDIFGMQNGCFWRWEDPHQGLSPWLRLWKDNQRHHLHQSTHHWLEKRVFDTTDILQVSLDDSQLDVQTRELLDSLNFHSMLCWPLQVLGNPFGVIQLASSQPVNPLSQQQLVMAELLSKHAVMGIERILLLDSAEQRASTLETIRQVSLDLTSSLDLSQVLNTILENTEKLLRHDLNDAHIFLYRDGQIEFAAARFAQNKTGKPLSKPRPDGLTATVARQSKMIVVSDIRKHPLFHDVPLNWQGSIIGIPLKIREQVVGVMNVAHNRVNAFSTADLQILQLLADQAAIAIENARLHELIRQEALTDRLTNLPNRRALDIRLDEEIRRSRRYGRHFVIMMLDLNQFKKINDQYGHPKGDLALKQIAKNLRVALRDSDFLARYGGDEFSVILPECPSVVAWQVAQALGERIQSEVIQFSADRSAHITLSIGLATFPHQGGNAEDLISAADKALYRAKKISSSNVNICTAE